MTTFAEIRPTDGAIYYVLWEILRFAQNDKGGCGLLIAGGAV